MGKLIDITGQKFGPLKAIEYVGRGHYKCHCELCDGEREIWGADLRRGRYKSCGCLRGKKKAKKADKPAPPKQKVSKKKSKDAEESPAERKARKRAEKAQKNKEAAEKHEPKLVIKNGKTYPKSSKVVLFKGDLRYLAELCEEFGVKSAKVRDRLRNGWSVEQALGIMKRNK